MIVPEIRMATFVKAPPERAYDALTQAEQLDAWFTTGAEVDPRPGGSCAGAGSTGGRIR